jgi:hypothetical protein
MIKPPTIMTAMTGHLVCCQRRDLTTEENKGDLLAVINLHAIIPAGEGRLHIRDLPFKVPPPDRGSQTGYQQVQEPPPQTPLHRHVDWRHLASQLSSLLLVGKQVQEYRSYGRSINVISARMNGRTIVLSGKNYGAIARPTVACV